ncbi:hypothetical protein DV738_g1213, partial [Chaetothyriales sp. CBS 135597]
MLQIRAQTRWEPIGQEGDVLMSAGKRKASCAQSQPMGFQPTKLESGLGLPSSTPPPASPPLPTTWKKRRLAISRKLLDTENEFMPDRSISSAKVETLSQRTELPPETPAERSKSWLDAGGEILTKGLARLQNISMSKPKIESSSPKSGAQKILVIHEIKDSGFYEGDIPPSGRQLIENQENGEPPREKETDPEILLDVSQRYNQRRAKNTVNPAGKPQGHSSTPQTRPAFDSSSRAPAENWSTQPRHVGSWSNHQASQPSSLSLERREVTLGKLTEKSGARPKMRQGPSDSHKLSSFQLSPLSSEDGPSLTTQPTLPASQPQHVQASGHAQESQTASGPNVVNNRSMLGRRLAINMNDMCQVVEETERLKSQKKDLEIIQNVFHYIATLGAVDDLLTKEEDELRECQAFVRLVVDQCKPGIIRRSRIRHIRANMLARIGRIDMTDLPDDHNKVEQLYKEYLGSQRASDISAALKIIDDEIYELSVQRSKLQKMKYSSVKGLSNKPLRRQRTVESVSVKKAEASSGSDPSAQKSTKKPTKHDRQIHALSETRKVFQDKAPVIGTQSGPKDANGRGCRSDPIEAQAAETPQQGSDSMHHGRPSDANIQDEDLDGINKLENGRQLNEARSRAPVTQLFDPELVARMKQRTLEAGRVVMTGEGEGDEEQVEICDWNDADSDISASSSSSSSSVDGTVQLYKYTIRGQFVGTQNYSDGDTVTFKTFWKLSNATAYLQEIVKSLHREYIGSLDDHFELRHREHKGLPEQLLTIGANYEVQARLWTERELILVDTCKLAANKARKRRLAASDEVYQVTWEKTTTTTTNTRPECTENLSTQEQDTNNGIVKAGFSNNQPSPITTTIERCPDPVMHHNLASANRMAKEDFMSWYSQFFPVEEHKHSYLTEQGTLFFDYSGMLKQVNEAHEEALRRLGDVGYFIAEEEVVLGENKNDIDFTDAGSGHTTRTERMKVYVKPVMVLGPRN